MKRFIYLIIFIGVTVSHSFAQADSLPMLTFEGFMNRVRFHHPVAMQAELQSKRGDAVLMESRGAFDPKLQTDLSQKYFQEKQYYNLLDGALKLPTWWGVEFEGGYERNTGVFLNPENNVPNAGLWYAGVSLPVGRGLFIDERRAMLKQAKLFRESALLERQLMYNKLLFEAGKIYWTWFSAYHAQKMYEEAVALARQRLNAVRQSAELGDRPYIDTLEAGIQVQNRMLSLQQATVDQVNSRALLSIYLWQEGVIPIDIGDSTRPQDLNTVDAFFRTQEEIMSGLDSLIANHPALLQYDYKIDRLKVEQQWRKEQLKPTVNLKYNAINEAVSEDFISGYATNNYTWGMQLGFPLFLRKERGKLTQTNLKLNEIELDQSMKRASVQFEVNAAINSLKTAQGQFTLYERTVEDYRNLLKGERSLFDTGESSLFMVNSRELGYFNAQLKRIILASKIGELELKLQYAAGQLVPERLP